MSIEVRVLQETELKLANDFFNKIYSSNRSFENFVWEFIDGPNGKAIYIGAIEKLESSTNIVGIQCAIPLEFIDTDGQVILTAKSEDTLVDPKYRGQKIFERMYSVLFEACKNAGIKYIWGFTPASKAFERIGFQVPFKAHQGLIVYKPIKSFRYLSKLNKANGIKEKVKILGLSWLSLSKQILTSIRKETIELRAVKDNTLPTFFRQFYSKEHYGHIHQTHSYLNWRQNSNPYGNEFQNFAFIVSDKEIGQVSINLRSNIGFIEQMLFSPEATTQQKIAIVQLAAQNLRRSGADIIRVLCFNTNEELKQQKEILSKAGFTILNRGNWFVWKTLGENANLNPSQLLLNRFYLQGNQ